MFQATPFPQFTAGALLRRYAHFEGAEGDGAGAAGGEADKGGAGGDASKPTFTHTQDDVNKAAGKARKEGRDAANNDLLKELGFEKADDLKALIKQMRERDEAEKTEAQKAADAAAKDKARADKAEADLAGFRAEVETRERSRLRDSAITDALTKQNAKADKLLALLQAQHADAVAAVLSDEGKVDDKKLAALVETARKAYPEDFGRASVGTGSHSNGHVNRNGERPKVQTSGKL